MPKVAAVQMCSSMSVDNNLKMAAELISKGVDKGASLIVLPEMFAYLGTTNEGALSVKEPFGHGPIQDFLSHQAKLHKIWLVGGTIPIASQNPTHARAATLVFNDQGMLVARYDKIHLFDVVLSETEQYKESNTIEPGEKVVVIDTPIGKVGLAICYDIRFPELFRTLLHQGAEVFVVPAAFTVPTGEAHWEVLTRSRAIENFCYFVGACQGGVHESGRKTFGHSLIVNPWGTLIAQQPNTQLETIVADIELKEVTKARKSIPIEEHRRIFFTL